MTYDLNDPNLDFDIEQEAIVNALKGARGDRRMMAPELTGRSWAPGSSALGGIGAALTRAAGGINESRAMREQRDLAGEQQRRFDTLQQELTAPMTKEVEGYSYGQGPLMDLSEQPRETIQQSPLEQSKRRLDIYSRMSRLPMARGLAQAGIKSEVDFPERQALLEMQQAQQRELQAQRDHEKWRFAQQFKLTADQQKGIADARTAATANMPHIIAVQTEDADGRPVTKLIDKRTVESGDEYVKPPPAGKGANAQTEKAQRGVDDLLDKIKAAEQGLPYTSGMMRVLPKALTQFINDDKTKMADAFIGNLSAEQAHELYGAAFTAAEMQRAADFLPTQTDTADTLRSKITALRKLAEKKQARLYGKPDPHPQLFNDVLDPVAAPTAPAAPAKGGRVNPNDEAAFAKYYDSLPNGTSYVDPSGVRRIKGQK